MNQPFPQSAPQPTDFPTQGAPQAPSGLIPTWRGLKTGFGTPVREFVGTFNSWQINQARFGTMVQMDFNQCQILASDSPYPYAEVTIEIKYSDQGNSGWGVVGSSLAEAMGVELNALNIDALKGINLHMYRFEKDYGTNQQGDQMRGLVWKCINTLQPGESATQITGTTNEITLPPVTVAPSTNSTPPASSPSAPTSSQVAPVQNAEARALELLNGKNLAEFFQVALPDSTIKTDASISTAIMGGQFVESMIAAGRVTVDASGIHQVAS
jgi:hypothetical protein